MANLRDKNRKAPIDPVERRRQLKEEIIKRNAEEREASRKKKKNPTTPSRKRKPLGQAKPGGMSAIKKGGASPADLARQARKGPAKY